ncbi:uncharacterized protein BP01DRAFT_364790 [Aspergillus saccharolyticus JOP 1030-1]|uniref:Uncharacterized protein n=1 Tax=Aspergillus saccharolyticus JOP 1030-1 TaxID=1450539 RepID=A0A319A3A4_9EURO|nr:hypothetical protein BP01DRAFT_364790 [Aspergillus saccharolyticus JOP 1030-1]PYH46628.1 hypothetical protein BP01DRAFT_364790 [Aspergillus saccharolyticus JOP 1030-1]
MSKTPMSMGHIKAQQHRSSISLHEPLSFKALTSPRGLGWPPLTAKFLVWIHSLGIIEAVHHEKAIYQDQWPGKDKLLRSKSSMCLKPMKILEPRHTRFGGKSEARLLQTSVGPSSDLHHCQSEGVDKRLYRAESEQHRQGQGKSMTIIVAQLEDKVLKNRPR